MPLFVLAGLPPPRSAAQRQEGLQPGGEAPRAVVEESAELEPEVLYTVRLAGGGSRGHAFRMLSGQCVRVLLEKGDLNVLVTLTGPSGAPPREFISRRFGSLRLVFVAETSGPYHIQVTSLEEKGAEGSYQLRLGPPSDAAENDRADERAVNAYAEAERLRADWREDSLRRAAEKYAEASARWQSLALMGEASDAWEGAGDVYFILSDYRKALEFYTAARQASRGLGDRDRELRALNHIGYAHLYLGEYDRASQFFRRVLSSATPRGQRPLAGAGRLKAQALNNVGEVAYSLGRLKDSVNNLRGALSFWEQFRDRRSEALAHLNLGYAYSDSGDLTEAVDHFRQALALARAVAERRIEALSLTALGTIHSFLGEQEQALENHEQALGLFRQMGNSKGVGVALNSVGQAYEDLNQPRTALDNYLSALGHHQRGGNRDAEAVSRYYIGRVYRALGDNDSALESYEQSLSLSREMGKRRVEGYALIDTGTIYGLRGDRAEALHRYHRVLKLYRDISDRRGQSYALNSIGYLHYVAGDCRTALDYFGKALPLTRAAGDRNGEASTLYNLARAQRDCGLDEEAIPNVEASIGIDESIRTKVSSPELRTSYFASARDRYDLYIDLLMRLHKARPAEGHAVAALQASERARARSLLDTLNEARVNIRQGVDLKLLDREKLLRHLLASKAEYRMRLLNSAAPAADAREVEADIRGLTKDYQEALDEIRKHSPLYTTLTQPLPLNLSEIQAELKDESTLLLEFALGEKRSYLWAVTSDSIDSYELPSRSEIEEAARAVYASLTARQPRGSESDADYRRRTADADADYWRQARRLSKMLLGQAARRRDFTRLLVVADGALQYIPLEALPEPDDEEASSDLPAPLLLRHEFASLPSASVLAMLRHRPPKPPAAADKVVAVLADPVADGDDPRLPPTPAGPGLNHVLQKVEPPTSARLPFTLEEAEAITAAAPRGAVKVITGFEASRGTVVGGGVSKYSILHFAAHGLTDSEHPEMSGILLSRFNERGEREHGLLQLHDLYNLELSAQLTVLSACGTGLGKDVRGEGLIGLARGFMYAGSQSVVASLWKVDDKATAVLMGHFYEGLLKRGLPPAAALKDAKARMWRQRRWQPPYYWAGFILQGEYRRPISVEPTPAGTWARWKAASVVLALGVLAALFTLWRKLRRRA